MADAKNQLASIDIWNSVNIHITLMLKRFWKKKIAAPKIAHLHLNNNDKYWFLKIVIQNNKHASLSFKNN